MSACFAFGVIACDRETSEAPVSPSSDSSTLSSSASPKTIRIASFSVAVDYAPYLVAKRKGWFEETFKDDGIAVEYKIFQSLPPVNESFATNRIDVVFEAEPPALVAEAAGIDVVVPGISATLTQEILVGADSSIQTAADLKGKKVAVLAGTSSHYGLLKTIESAGLQPEDIEIVDMVPPDAKNAFETNQVDAWAVWPPFVQQAIVSGKGRILPKGDAVIQSIMVADADFAAAHPELIKELVSVLDKSKKWIQENPDEAQQILATELDLPLEVIQRSWSVHDWTAELTPEVTSDIQGKANFMAENGFLGKTVNVETDLIDTSFGE